MPKILIIEDNELVRDVLNGAAQLAGYETDVTEHGLEALAHFEAGRYDAVITDFLMPELDGLQVARRIRRLDPPLAILMVSGSLVELSEIAPDLKRLGIPVLVKPVQVPVLRDALTEAVFQTRSARAMAHPPRPHAPSGYIPLILSLIVAAGPTCTRCIVAKTGLPGEAISEAIAAIETTVILHRVEAVCRACRRTSIMFSVAPAP